MGSKVKMRYMYRMVIKKLETDVYTSEFTNFNKVMVLGIQEHRVGLEMSLYFSYLLDHGSFFSVRPVD